MYILSSDNPPEEPRCRGEVGGLTPPGAAPVAPVPCQGWLVMAGAGVSHGGAD